MFLKRMGLTLLVWVFAGVSLSAAIRIMPMGDSITYDANYADSEHPRPVGKRSGYRNYLYYRLTKAGWAVDFVGSMVAGQDIRPPFDPDNEGHPGWTTYDMLERAYTYMVHSQPDIVLLHLGTNDRKTTNPAGIEGILNEIDRYEHDSGKHVKVFVALIIDRKEPDGRIRIFNDRLNGMLQQRIAAGDDVVIVDMYRGAGLTKNDYADMTHPNDHGYYKMANVWFNALMLHQDTNNDLRSFVNNLVPSGYIHSIAYHDAEGYVELTTSIPPSGLRF